MGNLDTMHLRTTVAGWRDVLAISDAARRDALCRAYLETLRWPDGPRCPRCGSANVSRVPSRRQLDCRDCRYRFSVTSGTHLHDSAVPVWKWLVAVSLLVESEDGFPAHRLSSTIGVSYKTAWSLGHRIRTAMIESAPNTIAAEAGSDGDVARSYHQVSEKYRAAYHGEQAWRERHRDDPARFAGALRALLRSPHAAATGAANMRP